MSMLISVRPRPTVISARPGKPVRIPKREPFVYRRPADPHPQPSKARG